MAHFHRFGKRVHPSASMFFLVVIAAVLCFVALAVPRAEAETTGKASQDFGNVVIFVQFSDNDGSFVQDSSDVQKMVSHFDNASVSPRSLNGYMRAISYDQFIVDSYLPQYDEVNQTIAPITLDNTYAYYASQTSYTFISAVNAKITGLSFGDFSRYDADGNGFIDNVTYILDGGVDDSDRLSVFHSHKENYNGSGSGFNGMVNQVNIIAGDVAFGSLTGFGTINHEFMHSVGFPDLYTESGDVVPVGRWDLMATVANFMQYPLAYMRSTEYAGLSDTPGWLTIDTLTTDQSGVELVPASSESGDQAFILKSSLSSSEIFVVEYRQKAENVLDSSKPGANALDTKIPGTGLVVYRINTLVPLLNNRVSPNNLGVYVFRADPGDDPSIDGLGASFFSQESGRTQIGSTDLSVTDGALTFSDGTNSGIYIHNIGSAKDTISFDVDFADTEDAGLWSSVAGADVAGTSSSSIASAIDNSTVYAAYDDGSQLKVASSANDGAWAAVGNALPNYYQGAQLCISNGALYASYIEGNTYKNVLYKYSGSSWTKIATLGSDDSYANTALCSAADGVYFAYCDKQAGFSNNIHAVNVSSAGVVHELYAETSGSKFSSQLHLCQSAEGACLAYRNGDTPVVVSLGATPTALAVPSISGSLQDITLAESNGILFAATSSANGVRVWKYAEDAWVQLGDTLSSSSAYAMSLTAMNGEPFVLLSRQGNGESANTVVMRYSDDSWAQEGLAVDSSHVGGAQLNSSTTKLYAAVLSPRSEYDAYPVVKTKDVSFTTEEPDPVDLDSATVVTVPSVIYNGAAQTPAVTVTLDGETLVEGADYTVSYENNQNVGTADITVTGKGNYKGSAGTTFEIAKAPIVDSNVEAVPSQPFTGSAITPKPPVTVDGNSLVEGTDFDYSWSNNTVAGSATVTITGKGNYSGVVSKTFTIKEPVSIASATIDAISSQTYAGKALTPTPKVTLGGVVLKAGTDYTYSYSGNVNVTNDSQKAIVVVTGIGLYKDSVQTTFKISPTALKVSTGSASKVFDGTALKKADASLVGLVGDDASKAKVNATGSQTAVGSSKNTYTISWNSVDSKNYTITEVLGTLTVTDTTLSSAPLNVKAANTTKASAPQR